MGGQRACLANRDGPYKSTINVCAGPGMGYAGEYSKSGKKFIALGYATAIYDLIQLPN